MNMIINPWLSDFLFFYILNRIIHFRNLEISLLLCFGSKGTMPKSEKGTLKTTSSSLNISEIFGSNLFFINARGIESLIRLWPIFDHQKCEKPYSTPTTSQKKI